MDEDAKRKKLEKNRSAAQKFRQRQKEQIETLEVQVEQLQSQNADANAKMVALQTENNTVREQVLQLRKLMQSAVSMNSNQPSTTTNSTTTTTSTSSSSNNATTTTNNNSEIMAQLSQNPLFQQFIQQQLQSDPTLSADTVTQQQILQLLDQIQNNSGENDSADLLSNSNNKK